MIGKLTSARVLKPWTLELAWDDGARLTLDLADLIQRHAVLAPLADPAEFAHVRVSGDGWSLEWPCGVDFGAPQLRAWAEAQARAAVPA